MRCHSVCTNTMTPDDAVETRSVKAREWLQRLRLGAVITRPVFNSRGTRQSIWGKHGRRCHWDAAVHGRAAYMHARKVLISQSRPRRVDQALTAATCFMTSNCLFRRLAGLSHYLVKTSLSVHGPFATRRLSWQRDEWTNERLSNESELPRKLFTCILYTITLWINLENLSSNKYLICEWVNHLVSMYVSHLVIHSFIYSVIHYVNQSVSQSIK